MGESRIQYDEMNMQKEESTQVWQEDKRVRHRVEVQALQIDRFLARHDIKAEVERGAVRSDWIDFDLRSQLSDGWQRLSKMTNGLVGALGVPDVRISRENGNLRLMVHRDAAHPVDLLDLLAAAPGVSGGEVILGIDEQGRPVILDLFTNEMSHVLVTGLIGAGKSGLLRSIAVSLAISSRQSDIQLCIISAGNSTTGLFSKSNQLLPLNYLPHLQFPVTQNIEEAAEALSFLADEITYREEAELNTPKLVVLIDDADWLVAKGGQRILQPLIELLEASDDTGLRLLLAAAEPNQAPLAQLMRYGTQLRLIGRVSDADQAFLLTGEDATGAENLNGRGDFLAVSYGQIIRFQSAFIDDYDLHLTLSELHRSNRNILIAKRKADLEEIGKVQSEEAAQVFTVDSEDGRISFTPGPTTSAKVIQGQVVESVVTEEMSLVIGEEEEALTFRDVDPASLEQNDGGGQADLANTDDDLERDVNDKQKRPPITITRVSDNSTIGHPGSEEEKVSRDEDFSVQLLPLELEYSDIDDDQWANLEESDDRSENNSRYH